VGPSGEPLPAFQIENQSYLESALGLPHQPYYGSFYNRLAAMVRSIAANHALVDGNKRLAVTVLHSTLLVNGYVYLWSNEDAVSLVLRCATVRRITSGWPSSSKCGRPVRLPFGLLAWTRSTSD
jgi:prophage maintenance system killer protein